MKLIHFVQQPTDNRGQIAVIVLLIMAVLLVIGISLASRTSEEIAISTQQQDSTRVFNAAEAGIEKALSSDFGVGDDNVTSESLTIDDINVRYEILSGGDSDAISLAPGDTVTAYLESGNPSVSWPCNSNAALILTAYYRVSGEVGAIHEAVRPEGSGIAPSFDAVSCNPGEDATFSFEGIPSDREFLRVTALYNTADVTLSGVIDETQTIRSEAQRENTDGNTEFRAIEVTRTTPAPPSIFDYALYSGGSLTK
ncbi:MAG: pilus assembly PilX N-terminal domain-containing protein [Patescibacteria group bacterium]